VGDVRSADPCGGYEQIDRALLNLSELLVALLLAGFLLMGIAALATARVEPILALMPVCCGGLIGRPALDACLVLRQVSRSTWAEDPSASRSRHSRLPSTASA
jgi:hypothetical protein